MALESHYVFSKATILELHLRTVSSRLIGSELLEESVEVVQVGEFLRRIWSDQLSQAS